MLEKALTILQDHGPKLVGLTLGFIPVLWGIYRARREWRKREFMSRFSISLNVLRPENNGMVLWIPAAGEFDLEEVFHRNRMAVKIVRKAAFAATPEEPFLVTIPRGRPGLDLHRRLVGASDSSGATAALQAHRFAHHPGARRGHDE